MLEADVVTLLLLLAGSVSAGDTLYDHEIAVAIADVKDVHPVPAALVKAVITQESSWNPRAVSRAGALGLMQLLPTTAAKVGVSREELFDPAKNILAGVRLLAVLLRHYKGDVISALTAYNARPRRLFAPIPQNGETPGYVKSVLAYYARYAGGKLHVVPEHGRNPQAGEPLTRTGRRATVRARYGRATLNEEADIRGGIPHARSDLARSRTQKGTPAVPFLAVEVTEGAGGPLLLGARSSRLHRQRFISVSLTQHAASPDYGCI